MPALGQKLNPAHAARPVSIADLTSVNLPQRLFAIEVARFGRCPFISSPTRRALGESFPCHLRARWRSARNPNSSTASAVSYPPLSSCSINRAWLWQAREQGQVDRSGDVLNP